MEGKTSISTILLIILLVMNMTIMGFFVFRLYIDKQNALSKVESLNYELMELQNNKMTSDNEIKLLKEQIIELQQKNGVQNEDEDQPADEGQDIYEKQETVVSENTIEEQQPNDKQNKKNTNDIIKYELQTHEYFSKKPSADKYIIDSETELNKFYSIYSDKLNIDTNYLEDNSIFIQVATEGSGSTQNKLSAVTFDNNTVNFSIDRNTAEMGTSEMAFWYFVAIIPNEQLDNLDLSSWVKPSQIK